MPNVSPLVFFVSYARADSAYPPNRERLTKFIEDLSARVAIKMGVPQKGISFFDVSNIDTGTVWISILGEALGISRVGVTLYSPSYFNSEWCGREFQVLRERIMAAGNPSGIVPVLWTKCTTLPPCVQTFQYTDGAFPPEYAQVGLQQLVALNVYRDQYELTLDAIAERIVTAERTNPLRPLQALRLEDVRSAWEVAVAADPNSHKEGGIAKTCFVFVSRLGWGWQPYINQRQIGAMAQQISGELGLRYEEIDCDKDLPKKLRETRKSNVPTVLFGDPASLQDEKFAQPMREYDELYLLNCGTLVPWDESSKTIGEGDKLWHNLKERVCQQKTKQEPPHHEWRSIFSYEDLVTKTRMVIENIRLKLLQQILSDDKPDGDGTVRLATNSAATVLKAEDTSLVDSAAAQGIRLDTAPQIGGSSK